MGSSDLPRHLAVPLGHALSCEKMRDGAVQYRVAGSIGERWLNPTRWTVWTAAAIGGSLQEVCELAGTGAYQAFAWLVDQGLMREIETGEWIGGECTELRLMPLARIARHPDLGFVVGDPAGVHKQLSPEALALYGRSSRRTTDLHRAAAEVAMPQVSVLARDPDDQLADRASEVIERCMPELFGLVHSGLACFMSVTEEPG